MSLNLFKKKKNIIIGALHLPPLLGYPDSLHFKNALKNALADLEVFHKAGFDAVIIENNYDIPHTENVTTPVAVSMAVLAYQIKQVSKIPVGISVLWNDYKTALSIAKSIGASFIRIPVFVDTIKTSCGVIKGIPKEVIDFRKSINAENIKIFTDIHVKHSKLLSSYSLLESAKRAIKFGSDALIITGNWTGQEPSNKDLEILHSKIGTFPVFAGSGVSSGNIKEIFSVATGCIVSTSLKKGSRKTKEINVKSYNQRVDYKKCLDLVNQLKQ